MEGILVVGSICLVCLGVFFNEFVHPGLERRRNAQESRGDTPEEKTTQPLNLY